MHDISVTFEVSNLDVSKLITFSKPENAFDISTTFLVLNLDISKLTNS